MQELGLREADMGTDDDFLRALEVRLDVLLRQDPERLARMLYRLDVDERAADAAIADAANAAAALARLMLERMNAKAATRADFSAPASEADADLLL